MLALKPGGRGDVTTSHKLWEFNNGPDVPTPTSDGKYLYVVNDGGVVYCLDLKTGAAVYGPERLKPGTYSASPTLADGTSLRHQRGRDRVGVRRRTEVPDPGRERDGRIHAELDRGVAGAAVPADREAPVRDRDGEGDESVRAEIAEKVSPQS